MRRIVLLTVVVASTLGWAQGEPASAEALVAAAAKGDVAAVRKLLDAGVNANATAPSGESALFAAVRGDHPEVVGLLLQRGAEPNAFGPHGVPAYEHARKAKSGKVLSLLHKAGAVDYSLKIPDCNAALEHSESADVRMRLYATWVLGSCGGKGLAHLRFRMKDKDARVRAAAVDGLLALGRMAREAAGDLNEALTDPEPAVRIPAAEALVKIGTDKVPRAVGVLVSALDEPAAVWRERALSRLVEEGWAKNIPPPKLAALLVDPSPAVRRAATRLAHAQPDAVATPSTIPALAACGKGVTENCFLTPCRRQGDFDGDGQVDLARLVVNGKGQRGVAFLFASGTCALAGAGAEVGSGGANFAWLKQWALQVARDGKGQALHLDNGEGIGGWVFSRGGKLVWQQHGD